MLANLPWLQIINATGQTIYMVLVASVLSILIGLILGIYLFNSRASGLAPRPWIYQALNVVVNIGRSIPYVILMIALIPLTRFLVGSVIGTNAAIVTLTIAAIPFYARLAENALLEVPEGLIEAGYAMGATRTQIITKILLPESLAALINGATLTIISLIGYSAMAGAVGGGGLGELAINYGYQRFDVSVMLMTVIVLIVLVQLVQFIGDKLAKKPNITLISIVTALLLALSVIIQLNPFVSSQGNAVRVGIMAGVNEEIMKVAQQEAMSKYHLKIKLVSFNDYVLPNSALNDGDIDANIFQHVPYLDAQIKARHYDLVPIAKTFIYPMGFYSKHYHSINEIPDGSKIAIPNDPSNGGRALLLLKQAGLIKLKSGVGLKATIDDIAYNPHHFQLTAIDAAQIARALPDIALGALTNDYVKLSGFVPSQALLKEDANSPYANVIVVRAKDKNKKELQELAAVMHSKAVVDATLKLFPDGAAIPA